MRAAQVLAVAGGLTALAAVGALVLALSASPRLAPVAAFELARSAPAQRNYSEPGAPISQGRYRLWPMATFEATTVVLGAERYRFDALADLAPVDLALAWGPLARDETFDDLTVRQYGRFYFWRQANLNVPMQVAATHSANMHMIPADERVARTLKSVRRGDVVRFSGELVNVHAPGGRQYATSLIRSDRGAGACEIVLVRTLEINPASVAPTAATR